MHRAKTPNRLRNGLRGRLLYLSMDGAIFAHSWMVFGVTALRETIRSLRVVEVDAVIDINGGWPVK